MVGDTVGRGRHNGSIWNTRDGAQGLGRLEVGLGRTTRTGIETRRSHVFTITDLECAILGVVRRIVRTPKAIIDVLAISSGVLAIRIAQFDTESMAAHEADVGQDLPKLAIKIERTLSSRKPAHRCCYCQ